MPKFIIRMRYSQIQHYHAEVEVEAESEEQAQRMSRDLKFDDLPWEHTRSEAPRDYDLFGVWKK